MESPLQKIDVQSWIYQLQDKLEIIRDCTHVRNGEESRKRKKLIDKNKLFEPLTLSEKATVRIPRLHSGLEPL